MTTRDERGQFLPGHSGNPSGKPRTPAHIRAMLEGLTEEAVEALAAGVRSKDEKVRMVAATQVLDRVLGKPVTPSVVAAVTDYPTAHLDAIRVLALRALPVDEDKPPMTVIDKKG